LILTGCNVKSPDISYVSRQEILETDIQMSAMAEEKGFHLALLSFADDSLVKPEEGKFPIIGKPALETNYAGTAGTKGITWKPFKADASSSGDLGYTLGNWTFVSPDSTFYGNYYTIWKRQPDGGWKWVADGGNGTPRPE
jgi:ketosteroid isomerase-like protein